MNIKNYTKIRDLAWQVLLDCKIDTLPVSTVQIAKRLNVKILRNSCLGILKKHESGLSLYQDGLWFIVFDDSQSYTRCRFTLAHELGHILLNHPLHNGFHSRTTIFASEKSEIEREADIFASRLLAPACVLWGLNLHSAEEIAGFCDLSQQAAKIRAKRLEVLYRRKKFLLHPLERKVFEQFQLFIDQQKGGYVNGKK